MYAENSMFWSGHAGSPFIQSRPSGNRFVFVAPIRRSFRLHVGHQLQSQGIRRTQAVGRRRAPSSDTPAREPPCAPPEARGQLPLRPLPLCATASSPNGPEDRDSLCASRCGRPGRSGHLIPARESARHGDSRQRTRRGHGCARRRWARGKQLRLQRRARRPQPSNPPRASAGDDLLTSQPLAPPRAGLCQRSGQSARSRQTPWSLRARRPGLGRGFGTRRESSLHTRLPAGQVARPATSGVRTSLSRSPLWTKTAIASTNATISGLNTTGQIDCTLDDEPSSRSRRSRIPQTWNSETSSQAR